MPRTIITVVRVPGALPGLTTLDYSVWFIVASPLLLISLLSLLFMGRELPASLPYILPGIYLFFLVAYGSLRFLGISKVETRLFT